MSRPKVWVVNQRNHRDYTRAEKFGELNVVTKGSVNVFQIDNVVHEIASKLQGRTTSDDYVLVSGYQILNIIVAHHFMKKYGYVRLLQWEGNALKYSCITFRGFAKSLYPK